MKLLRAIWRVLRDLRAPYFAAIGLPILLGSVIAWATTGEWDIGLFVMSMLAGIFLQAGTNMTNDFFDHQGFGGQDNLGTLMPPQQVLQGALAFFVVGAMVGLYIVLATGPLVLVLGLFGIASGYAYSAPPFRLSGTGLGELLAGLNLGLLTTLGAYYVQTGRIDSLVIWVALPVALLMAAVLALNGFQPAKLSARRTLWSTLGAHRASVVYAIPAVAAFALLIIGVALNRLPQLSLLGLLGLPLSAITIVSAQVGRYAIAIASAVGAHLSTTALLATAFLIQGLLGGI